jgi:hypothetical protein
VVILDHLGRLSMLVIDRLVGAHKGERRLVVKVAPLAPHLLPHLLMRLCQQLDRFAPAVAVLLSARDTALRGLQCALGFAIPARREYTCAVRERSEGFYAKVNPGFLSSSRERLYGYISAREADIPAIRFPADRHRLRLAFNRSGPANDNPPDLGEDQDAVLQRGAVATLLIGEAVVVIRARKARLARRLTTRDAPEERLEGTVELGERVLQDLGMDVAVLGRTTVLSGNCALCIASVTLTRRFSHASLRSCRAAL